MALCNEAVSQTLCLVWMLEMMSCRNNGLFWLVHIVKLGNGWTTEVRVLLLRSTEVCESRLMSRTVRSVLLERISIPTLKNTEGKGETITPKSNNTPCKYPQSNLKIQIMRARRISLSIRKEAKKAAEVSLCDWRKTITVNRSRSFGLFLDKLTRDGVMVDKCVFFFLAARPPSVDFQRKPIRAGGACGFNERAEQHYAVNVVEIILL